MVGQEAAVGQQIGNIWRGILWEEESLASCDMLPLKLE